MERLEMGTEKEGPRRGGMAVVAGVLAAAPHVVIAVYFFRGTIFSTSFFGPFGLLALLLAAGLLLLLAWRQRWPLWSSNWVSYWLILGTWSLAYVAQQFILFFVLMFLGLLVLLATARRRPLYSMLALSPLLLALHWAWVLELVQGYSQLYAAVWLLLAAAGAAATVWGTLRRGLLTMGAFFVLSSQLFIWGVAFLQERSTWWSPRPALSLELFVNDFAPATLSTLALLLALALLYLSWQGARRREPQRYALLLCGLLLATGGGWARRALALDQTWLLGAVMGAGLLLGLAAAVAIGRWERPRQRAGWAPLLLALAPLFVFVTPTPFSPQVAWNPAASYPAAVALFIVLYYAAAVVWLVGAAWVVAGPANHGDEQPAVLQAAMQP